MVADVVTLTHGRIRIATATQNARCRRPPVKGNKGIKQGDGDKNQVDFITQCIWFEGSRRFHDEAGYTSAKVDGTMRRFAESEGLRPLPKASGYMNLHQARGLIEVLGVLRAL